MSVGVGSRQALWWVYYAGKQLRQETNIKCGLLLKYKNSTVNSLSSQLSRNRDLVSVLSRVRDSGVREKINLRKCIYGKGITSIYIYMFIYLFICLFFWD